MSLYTPEIFAYTVLKKLDKNLKLRGLSFDATNLVGEIRAAGDKVHFPTLTRNATAAAVVKGTALVPSAVAMSDNEATLYQIAASKRLYDIERAQIKGNMADLIAQELADAMAKKMDTDLGTAVISNAAYKSATASATVITAAEIETARDLFGDQNDIEDFAGLVINSRLRSSFMGMDQFTSDNKTYVAPGNGLVVNGCIGFYSGIPVFMDDNCGTWDDTLDECVSIFLKKNALQYVLSQNITYEEQRPSNLLATDMIVSSIYACSLVDTNNAVLIRKTTT